MEDIKRNDEIRQQQLEQDDLAFLRFSNDEVRLKPEEVVQKIETFSKGKLENK